MPRRPTLLLVPLGLALLCASAARPQPPGAGGKGAAGQGAPRTDRYGDPLPAGALARIGTVRLRHAPGALCLAFAPDGKTLASGGTDQTVRLWDLDTGKQVRQLGSKLGEVSCLLFSPDGKLLYAATDDENRPVDTFGDLANNPAMVSAWDLAAAKPVLRFAGPTGYVTSLALTRDGRTLAGATQPGPAVIWETGAGTERLRLNEQLRKPARRRPGSLQAALLALSPDGKILARAQSEGSAVELCDGSSGKVLRTLQAAEGVDALAFSPDGRTLAVADRGKAVTLWDAPTGKKVRQTGEHGGRARSLLFAPDGKVLACASGRAVHLWDPATGKEIARIEGHHSAVRCLAFSADGKRLAYAGGDGALRVWDLAARKPVHPAFGEPTGEVSVALVGAGDRLAVRHTLETSPWERLHPKPGRLECVLHIWSDFRGQRPSRLVAGPVVGDAPLVVSPDGKFSVLPGAEDLVRVVDNASGKELRRFGIRAKHVEASPEAFSPDGKFLAVRRTNPRGQLVVHLFQIWDVAAGTVVCWLKSSSNLPPSAVRFSPCGRLLAIGDHTRVPPTISFWDVATGKLSPRFQGEHTAASWFAFTPDGRFLVAGGDLRVGRGAVVRGAFDFPVGPGLQVRELLTGKPALVLPKLQGSRCGSVSPDGAVLALGFENGRVSLHELDTGKLLRRLDGHRGAITSLAFTPDGKALVSGSADSTALVWDVAAVGRGEEKPLAPAELEKLWADLASADAGPAYRAMVRLSQAPKQTVPFLKARLRAVPIVGAERLRKLIADLDSRSYATRTRATKELGELDEIAVPSLRAALKADPPLEARRRLDKLLAAATRPVKSPEWLRALRALYCLERPGTAETRALLADLAKGAPEARLTQEARGCLRRLAARP
jgi:WD40 repeat protein